DIAEGRGPGLGVLADPSVMDQPDRDRVQEVELLAAAPPGHHQARILELPQVLHHPEPRHAEPRLERAQGLSVLAEQLVEQAPPGRIGQGLEYLIHVPIIGDRLVTCQRADGTSADLLAAPDQDPADTEGRRAPSRPARNCPSREFLRVTATTTAGRQYARA